MIQSSSNKYRVEHFDINVLLETHSAVTKKVKKLFSSKNQHVRRIYI